MGPRFEEIDAELAALSELRDKPAGTIRITATEHAADAILWPALEKLLPDYPDIKVEIVIDYGLTDIVAERYDAGVRLGEQVAKDMIAVRIGPDMRMAVVGAPSYFAKRPPPRTPQDLTAHDCINLRLPTHGGLYAWEFEKDGRELRVRVEGQLVFNSTALMLNAALAGLRPGVPARGAGAERTSPTGGSSGCSPTGARPSPATTSTTRAAASPRRPSPCWSMRCATGLETGAHTARPDPAPGVVGREVRPPVAAGAASDRLSPPSAGARQPGPADRGGHRRPGAGRAAGPGERGHTLPQLP